MHFRVVKVKSKLSLRLRIQELITDHGDDGLATGDVVESALLLGLAVSNGVDVERSVVGYKWVTSDIFSACVISYVISNLGGAWADTE